MLPSFFIIGAAKAGTTSLYQYLRQHPDVFMPDKKEPDFFAGIGPYKTREAYEALFETASPRQARGEASVSYLPSEEAPTAIKALVPDARLIAILRDPAARAYSHYNMMVRFGDLPNRPYEEALQEAMRRGDLTGTGIPLSHYAVSLRRYFDTFGREPLRIFLYEELKHDPARVVQAAFEHVGVDPAFEPDLTRTHNATALPSSDRLNRLIWRGNPLKRLAKAVLPERARRRLSQAVRRANERPVPPLSKEARALALNLLEDDIKATEKLLDVDLSSWKRR